MLSDSFLTVNPNYRKHQRVIIVDNFYKDPDQVRKFALEQDYYDDDGYIGRRTRKQFFIPGLKEAFEDLLGIKITKWEEPVSYTHLRAHETCRRQRQMCIRDSLYRNYQL